MAATPCGICLELPHFLRFPGVLLLPQGCLEKSLLLQLPSQEVALDALKGAAFAVWEKDFLWAPPGPLGPDSLLMLRSS